MWTSADRYPLDSTGACIDGIVFFVEAAREKQGCAVGRDVAHVRASPVWNGPMSNHGLLREVDFGYSAGAVGPPTPHAARSAIGNKQLGAVSADHKPVGPHPGWNEALQRKRCCVEHVDPIIHHVS